MPLAARSVWAVPFLLLASMLNEAVSTSLDIFEDELDWTSGSVLGLQRGFKLTKASGQSAISEANPPDLPRRMSSEKVFSLDDEDVLEVLVDADGSKDKRGSMVRSEPT
mmetsp:Transcript_36595/g.66352  ORF Transcript_36595/g.66352 Transcript_36595/m.66352 type:complete len:109 (-) Transcript_36595:186-512(-)|eukprot:CAMPEP_0197656458 /NCGR_PEP_ID=MMETSP1338-20131121/41939_1 /TAXON_ID=43686 ORGANISM="Pelagodinium beii, Strain RCC1491" /NCGR_SAMPLE_ID=MMETSP1338 /ASSEMBLY_ACC=CAM_ASM_000754 /LENGTH=108 /DNA_ID=CAMNT_0043232463 /DNA_START=80 /DNA_END=406 /DNA_ORIENTATION=+